MGSFGKNVHCNGLPPPPSKSGLAEFPKNNHRKIKQLSCQAFPPARQPSDPVPKILFPV
jgi:hypothetical protein